ncbi:thiaminase II [Tepidibacter hydrothermalis]|uniref:Aminopyrimidine aminohydrolase n=1 Tax=Tepidibacter hydrothermalis TaxID=3036126 RepID=A0ABY8EDC8_9FIRM|nr:thiaminase II [Tepidibacter hydrothermalis]WFD09589.1 thiaminase II [Tepidibacter hydrothermalis]
MKISEYLLKEVAHIWDKYIDHPFVKQIGEGSLPKEKFEKYLIQDYLYLKEYSKVFCMGVIKAKTMDEMRFFYKSIKGTMEDETAVHIEYLKKFGIEEIEIESMDMNLVTTSYISYMQALALTGDLEDIVATTLPCTWSYNYIGKYLKDKYSDCLEGNYYKAWIDTYASDGYCQFTQAWIDYIDDLCADITDEKKENIKEIFIKSSLYELEFWNMAYTELD